MLFIKPDMLLGMAYLGNDKHVVNDSELNLLAGVIKKNLAGSKVKTYYTVYPSVDGKDQNWQNYFCYYDGEFRPFNEDKMQDEYTNRELDNFIDSLVREGVSLEQADEIVHNLIQDYKKLVNKKDKEKVLVRGNISKKL